MGFLWCLSNSLKFLKFWCDLKGSIYASVTRFLKWFTPRVFHWDGSYFDDWPIFACVKVIAIVSHWRRNVPNFASFADALKQKKSSIRAWNAQYKYLLIQATSIKATYAPTSENSSNFWGSDIAKLQNHIAFTTFICFLFLEMYDILDNFECRIWKIFVEHLRLSPISFSSFL